MMLKGTPPPHSLMRVPMSITFTSHVKHRLGNWLLGSNDSMSVPDDFYWEKFDRNTPHADDVGVPDVYNSRMATAQFRLDHTWRVAKLQGWILTILIVVLSLFAGLLSGVVSKWDAHEATVKQEAAAAAAKQDAADFATQNRCLALTPDQRQSDQACVETAARQAEKQAQQQKAYWAGICAGLSDEKRAHSPNCNGTN